MFRIANTWFVPPRTNERSQVQILRGLEHPNIVKIYQFYPKDTGYYYVVMEFLLGGELFDHVVNKVHSALSFVLFGSGARWVL